MTITNEVELIRKGTDPPVIPSGRRSLGGSPKMALRAPWLLCLTWEPPERPALGSRQSPTPPQPIQTFSRSTSEESAIRSARAELKRHLTPNQLTLVAVHVLPPGGDPHNAAAWVLVEPVTNVY